MDYRLLDQNSLHVLSSGNFEQLNALRTLYVEKRAVVVGLDQATEQHQRQRAWLNTATEFGIPRILCPNASRAIQTER